VTRRTSFIDFLRQSEGHGGLDDLISLGSGGIWGAIDTIGTQAKEEQAIRAEMSEASTMIRLTAKKYNAKGFEE
jgi:hypothetical protein